MSYDDKLFLYFMQKVAMQPAITEKWKEMGSFQMIPPILKSFSQETKTKRVRKFAEFIRAGTRRTKLHGKKMVLLLVDGAIILMMTVAL